MSTESWHDSDFMDEGDTWDHDYDLDPEYNPLKTTLPAWTLMGALVYKSLLDSYGPKLLPAFDPVYVPQSARVYSAAVGLAEIGVTQQLPQLARIPKDSSKPEGWTLGKTYAQYWEYGETFAWAIGAAASIAVASVIARGAKGGAFRTAIKYGWDAKGRSPLWSVTRGVTEQLAQGYVPNGSEVVKERTTFGEGVAGDFGQGSAFAFGLTGYI